MRPIPQPANSHIIHIFNLMGHPHLVIHRTRGDSTLALTVFSSTRVGKCTLLLILRNAATSNKNCFAYLRTYRINRGMPKEFPHSKHHFISTHRFPTRCRRMTYSPDASDLRHRLQSLGTRPKLTAQKLSGKSFPIHLLEIYDKQVCSNLDIHKATRRLETSHNHS